MRLRATASGQLGQRGARILDPDRDQRPAGSLLVDDELEDAARRMPFGQTAHRVRVGSAAEEDLVPTAGLLQVADGHAGQNLADSHLDLLADLRHRSHRQRQGPPTHRQPTSRKTLATAPEADAHPAPGGRASPRASPARSSRSRSAASSSGAGSHCAGSGSSSSERSPNSFRKSGVVR